VPIIGFEFSIHSFLPFANCAATKSTEVT